MLEGKPTGSIGGGVQTMSSFWKILSLRPWGTAKWTRPGGSWEYFLAQSGINRDFPTSALVTSEARSLCVVGATLCSGWVPNL